MPHNIDAELSNILGNGKGSCMELNNGLIVNVIRYQIRKWAQVWYVR